MLEQIFSIFIRGLPAMIAAYRKLSLSTWVISALLTGLVMWGNAIEETPRQLSPEQRAEVEADINQEYDAMSEEDAKDVCRRLLNSDYDLDFVPDRCVQWQEG